MNRQKRTPTLGDTPVTHAKGSARDRLRDAGSKELAQLAKKVGNGQVGALIGSAKEKRDALLAFVQQRLATIQTVQRAEQKELAEKRDWWLRVSRGKPGFTLPDPTRWHAAALLYRRAAATLCAGDIGRGAQLLDQAVRAERAAFDTVPVQVELPSSLTAPSATPDERPFVDEGETAPPTAAPGLFKTADTILRMSDTSDLLPVARNNPVHHWWDAPEEEKPEDAKKAAGKPGGPAVDARERKEAPRTEAPERRPEPAQRREEPAEERVEERAADRAPAREADPKKPKKEKKP